MWVRTTVEPPPGRVPTVLTATGLRINGQADSADGPDGIAELAANVVADSMYEVTGSVRGVRDFYAQRGGPVVQRAGAEFVISVGEDSFHASVNHVSAREIQMLGERVIVTGQFSLMGDYEWDEEFDFADTRADWKVTAVDGWMLCMHRSRS